MSQIEHGSVQANGLTVHYLTVGSGPLVLCQHGFPDHPRSFRYQLSALANAGFQVVAPYLRGYFPTELPANNSFQTAMLAKDVLALLDIFSPHTPAIVIGHDWGALAAYGAALSAPERISKLITMAVPYGPRLQQEVLANYAQTKRSWHMYFMQTAMAVVVIAYDDFAFIKRLWQDWSPTWAIPAEDMAAVKETFRQPGVLQAAIDYYRYAFDFSRHLPELADLQARIMVDPIQVPTLNLHGEVDGCIGVEALAGMSDLFPQGLRQVVVPDAGHFLHLENPDRINQEIIQFLQDSP